MFSIILAGALGLGFGFGAGRIKNSKKLADIKAEILKAETSTVADVKALAAKIKSKL